MNIDALKKELKSFSKQKLIEEYKDLYLAHDMLKQTSIALNKQLDQANEKLNEHNEYFKEFNCKDNKVTKEDIEFIINKLNEWRKLQEELRGGE